MRGPFLITGWLILIAVRPTDHLEGTSSQSLDSGQAGREKRRSSNIPAVLLRGAAARFIGAMVAADAVDVAIPCH